MHSLRAFWWVFAVVATSAAADEASSQVQDSTIVVSRIVSQWEARHHEIDAADLRYRVYRSVSPAQPLSPEQLDQLIEQYGLRASPRRIPEFLAAVGGERYQVKFDERRLCFDGINSRFESGSNIKVQDPDYMYTQNLPNKTIHVEWAGISSAPIPPINWFRDIPPYKNQPQNYLKVRSATGSAIHLYYDSTFDYQGQTLQTHCDYECDPDSGIPLRKQNYVEGHVSETNYQLSLVESTGVHFPTCMMRVIHNRVEPKGSVREIDLTEIVDMRINEGLSRDLFLMPKPQGFEVIDKRGDTTTLGVSDAEAKNVRDLLGPVAVINNLPKPIPWQRRAFFIVNGLSLICLGIWLWRRVSIKEPKR